MGLFRRFHHGPKDSVRVLRRNPLNLYRGATPLSQHKTLESAVEAAQTDANANGQATYRIRVDGGNYLEIDVMPIVLGQPWQGGFFGNAEVGFSASGSLSDGAPDPSLAFLEDFDTNGIPLYTKISDEYGLADTYPGSGANITFMGGEVVGNAFNWGDGNDAFASHQNVNVVDSVGSNAAGNDPQASGVHGDLRYAWRARYWNQQSGDAYQLRTLILRGFNLDDCYVRFYYKWGAGFHWPETQQKFLKAHPNVSSGDAQYWSQNLQIKNQLFQITGPHPDSTWDNFFHRSVDNGGAAVLADDINNEQGAGGTDANITFQDDTWYCIELRILASTPGGSDGRYQVWIDDVLWFDWGGVDSRTASQSLGIGYMEFHHIWQGTESDYPGDEYCYLKGLAVADSKIGPYDPVRGY